MQQLRNRLHGKIPCSRIYCIDFRDDDRTIVNPKKPQDIEMLVGLRHWAIVCRNHQKRVINSGCTGDHGMHKFFMARHIDKAKGCWAIGKIGITQFN